MIDFDAAYKVEEYRGIAWRIDGYATEWTEEKWEYIGEGDVEDEDNYIYYEPEEVEDTSRVRMHMVGDDREFIFDIEELTKLDEEDYCQVCGQIGCGHNF
jgi:hypothetical protein